MQEYYKGYFIGGQTLVFFKILELARYPVLQSLVCVYVFILQVASSFGLENYRIYLFTENGNFCGGQH